MKYGKLRPQGKVLDHWQLLHESDFEDTDTKLLLHLDGDVTDYATGKTVTNNAAFSTTVWKFGSQSGSFNGSSQYLSIPDSDDFSFGAGNFTIDFWVRVDTLSNARFIGQRQDASNHWLVQFYSGTTLNMQFYSGAVWQGEYECSFVPTVDVWYHLAFVRNGTTGMIFINGVSQTVNAITAFGTNNVGNLTGNVEIGVMNATGYLDGYLDEFRVVKGTAKWTANFTPPTAPYLGRTTTYPITKDRNTVLMISGEGVDASTSIIDETGKAVTANGNAQIDTAQYKFGQSSVLFDGSGDFIYMADSLDWYFGANDFTVDFWMRPSDWAGARYDMFYSQHVGGTDYIQFYKESGTGKIIFNAYESSTAKASYITTSAPSISNNVWYHIALVRNGSNLYLFIDGVSQTLTVNTAISANALPNIATELVIGSNQITSSTHFYAGWMDDYRVTKGLARWTSAFTPPLRTTALINGDTDEEYRLVAELVGGTTPGNEWVRLNNDSGANYGRQHLYGSGTSITANRNTAATALQFIDNTTAGDNSLGEMVIYAKSGYVRTAINNSQSRTTGTTVTDLHLRGDCWNNTTAPVAALTIHSGTSGLGVGSKIILYRKVQ